MTDIKPQVIIFDPSNVGQVGMLGNSQTWTGVNKFGSATDNVEVTFLDTHVEKDTLGSNLEYTK